MTMKRLATLLLLLAATTAAAQTPQLIGRVSSDPTGTTCAGNRPKLLYWQSGDQLVMFGCNASNLYEASVLLPGSFELPQSASQATCDATRRGWIQQTQASGQGDGIVECARLSDGSTYAWVPKRVRPPRFLEVSPAGGNYKTVQGAIDAIIAAGDASSTTRYRIDVLPGYYDERVTMDASYTDVCIHPGAVIRYTPDTTGGTFRIGTGTLAALTTDVWVGCGGRIERYTDGGTGDSAPEGAVYVGAESTYPTTTTWDRITIHGLTIAGSHDALQLFGVGDGAADVPAPYAEVAYNLLLSAHDCFTYKGAMRLYSHHNNFDVYSPGHPGMSVNSWKSTCFHMNVEAGIADNSWSVSATNMWFRSLSDTCYIRDGTNVGGAAQIRMVGFLFYPSSGVGPTIPRVEIINPSITLEYNRDFTPNPSGGTGVALIALHLNSAQAIADGNFIVSGLEGVIRQLNTGSSAPSAVYGLAVDGGTGINVRISGSMWGSNAKAASNAYATKVGTGNTIFSDLSTNMVHDPGSTGTTTTVVRK